MTRLFLELFLRTLGFSRSLGLKRSVEIFSRERNNSFLLLLWTLLEFLEHGLKFVFPQKPGALVAGIATSHSAAPLKKFVSSNDNYVWPYAEGNLRGQSIEPLYSGAPKACLKDEKLYELLALTDALRVGRVREKTFAIREIKKRIK